MPGPGDTGTDVVPARRNLMSYRKSEDWVVMTGAQLLRERCDKALRLPWRGAFGQSVVQWRKCCLSPKDVIPSGGSALERCPRSQQCVLGRGTVFRPWGLCPGGTCLPHCGHIHHATLHPWLSDIPDRCSEEGEHSRAEKSFSAAAAKQACVPGTPPLAPTLCQPVIFQRSQVPPSSLLQTRGLLDLEIN